MRRVTLRVPEQQLDEIERMVDAGEYPTQSEAIRDCIRDRVREYRQYRLGGRRMEVPADD